MLSSRIVQCLHIFFIISLILAPFWICIVQHISFFFHFTKSILSIQLPFSYKDEHFFLTLMCSDTGRQTEIHRSGVDRSGFGKDSNWMLETLAQHTQTHTQTEGSAFLENLSCTTNSNVFFLFLYFSFQRSYLQCPWSY